MPDEVNSVKSREQFFTLMHKHHSELDRILYAAERECGITEAVTKCPRDLTDRCPFKYQNLGTCDVRAIRKILGDRFPKDGDEMQIEGI